MMCRAAKRILGAQGKSTNWGPYCHFEILYALRCVLDMAGVACRGLWCRACRGLWCPSLYGFSVKKLICDLFHFFFCGGDIKAIDS